MRPPRPFAMLRTKDQWRRAAHDGTALHGDVVQLATVEEPPADAPGGAPPAGAGLAFDAHCRLYHSLPEAGQVERLLWAADEPPAPIELFAAEPMPRLGEFQRTGSPSSILNDPRTLAVDENERLFIAETGAGRILVYDLWSRRLLREARWPGRPVDLALARGSIFVLLDSPPGLVELNARTGPRALELPGGVVQPARLAVSATGELLVLDQAGGAPARILAGDRPPLLVPGATDIEFQSAGVLVVARLPKEDFLRFRIDADATHGIAPLKARHYDGRGIVRTPDGRIGFWTAHGFRHAVAARVRYFTSGRVTTFQLDSGEFQTVWGRIFLDACIPKETRIKVHCRAEDEPPDEATLPRTPPVNTEFMTIRRPDLSPPMPPLSLVPPDEEIAQVLHRRESGRELPWSPMAEGDSFETYEGPIHTAPGRYLWVTLWFEGNSLSTPRVRAVRAEFPSHDLLRRIPKIFSREERVASFLRRYLGMFDGFLGELEVESEGRHALIDPRGAPAELLPWLAGFVGLVLDERMERARRPDGRVTDARRQLIEEAVWLFRFRGTIPGLRRFLEIYLGVTPIFIEKFRVRGLGGALLGDPTGLTANSVLGAGFRIGGAIGEPQEQVLTGAADDAFETHAHRFTAIIPALLNDEEVAVVQHILDLHRPAHTLVEFCTVGAGMRVGRGLHVALTSFIGRTGGFQPLQVDASVLGRGSILGRPDAGTLPGASRLGEDSRVG
jgi:phage tail-like protein